MDDLLLYLYSLLMMNHIKRSTAALVVCQHRLSTAFVVIAVRRKLPCPHGRVVGSPPWAAGVPGEPRGHVNGGGEKYKIIYNV
eukprot:1337280-Pyramimonas_sp.AAC.2